MNAIMCELCGSNDVVKQGEYFVCQHCGTKYSLEDAKKLIGTVKIDSSDELKNLYELARRAKSDENRENAQKYYEMILVKDPNSWEAQFFSMYFKIGTRTTCDEMEMVINSLKNGMGNVLRLIKYYINDKNEQAEAIEEVKSCCEKVSSDYVNGCKYQYGTNSFFYKTKTDLAFELLYTLQDGIKQFFDTDSEISLPVINSIKSTMESTRAKQNENAEAITKATSSGCYVATAVYGSYDCPQVWTLRRYRDYTLAETWYGRAFIHTYYAISPALVKWFGKTQWFKNMWRPRLDKMVKRLNDEGVSAMPYQDRQW